MDGRLMEAYGLSGRFAALAGEEPAFSPGRVLSQERGLYRVVCGEGELLAEVSGKYRHDAATVSDYPAVGDFVLLEGAADGHAVIRRLLPRKSVFLRRAAGSERREQVVAANVDTLFLCMSLNHDYNLRRLERYLSIGWDSGARPVVVLTKADLCGETADRLRAAEAAALGADVLAVSSLGEDGYRRLLPYLRPGETIALIGSSGVGKSTLINRLLGDDRLATNGLRGDDRGRHTTTRRELFLLPGGGMVIDTPGMRELGMWDADEGLDRAFADVEALAAACRFADCTHGGEPGCAIQAALESGALGPGRWQSYQKLRGENDYARDSQSYLAAKEEKFKSIAKYNKARKGRP